MANLIARILSHGLLLAVSIFYFVQIFQMFEQKDEGILLNLWKQHVFMTNLTHTLVTLYYLIVFFQDLKELFNSRKNLSKSVYNEFTHVYYQLMLSLTLVVSLGYWILFTIDPKFVWGSKDPNLFNAYYTNYYRHGISHFLLYLELLFYVQTVFISKTARFILDIACILIYFLITVIQYFYFGKIVYPFQSKGPAVFIPIYISVSLFFAVVDLGIMQIGIYLKIFKEKDEFEQGEVQYEEVEVVNKSD